MKLLHVDVLPTITAHAQHCAKFDKDYETNIRTVIPFRNVVLFYMKTF